MGDNICFKIKFKIEMVLFFNKGKIFGMLFLVDITI